MRRLDETWSELTVMKSARRHRRQIKSVHARDEQIKKLEEEIARLRGEVDQLTVYRNMAYLDHLTGLRNRRYFEERLAQEVARAARSGTPCSVLMMDVDDFKRINDEYGHPTGDLVLRAVGDLLLHNQRSMDVSCRVGGDELAVILPGTGVEGAAAAQARLEQAAKDQLVAQRLLPGLNVSLSFGTATYPLDGDDIDELVLHADRAMYARKRARKPSSPGRGNTGSLGDLGDAA